MNFLQTIDILWLFHTYKDREYNRKHKSIENDKPECHKDIFFNEIFNAAYVAGPFDMSVCHYVLALSSCVWGISVITPLPLGEGRGEGSVGGSGFVAISFFFISCACNYSMNILSFLIFFI